MYKLTHRKYPAGSVKELRGHQRSLPPGRPVLCVSDVSLQTGAVYVPTAVISTLIMEMCTEPGPPPEKQCVCVCLSFLLGMYRLKPHCLMLFIYALTIGIGYLLFFLLKRNFSQYAKTNQRQEKMPMFLRQETHNHTVAEDFFGCNLNECKKKRSCNFRYYLYQKCYIQ